LRLNDAGVPCGPINDIAGAFQLADTLELNPITLMQRHAGTTIAQLSNPIQLSKTPPRYTLPPPTLGGDNEDILQWLNTPTQAFKP
jgi:crotonobetainyl-CoA:carnitine CoA-transferase CaiB-like acyl-CoA transferase